KADARGQVLGAKNPRIFWTGLIKLIQQGKCTPIVGPRVHGRWLPTRTEVAQAWATEHAYPFADKKNIAFVAQYLASNQGEDFPRSELLDTLMRDLKQRLPEELKPAGKTNTLTDLIKAVGWKNLVADDPNEVHRVLADLSLPLYLTTNCDSFMSEALAAAGRPPAREVCRWNDKLDHLPSLFESQPDYAPTPAAPMVYHLFGSDEEVDSVVLTEDGYMDYLVRISSEPERIPSPILAALANSSLMFLGYKLHDWEFRVIMRGLVAARRQRRSYKHIAVQLDVDDVSIENIDAVQSFLQQYFQDAEINIYWGSLEQFVAELREQWEMAGKQ
ncbi:MAG TPA: SIR2 family protein, partial [Anaerolineae bacterium]